MNDKKPKTHVSLPRTNTIVQMASALVLLLASVYGTQVHALGLAVKDAVSKAGIAHFKYIVNEDNTGTTATPHIPTGVCSPSDTNYPGSQTIGVTCPWVSIAGVPGSSPIYTQGDQDDIDAVSLPAGKYLISVLADGYKLDGVHVVGTGASTQAVTVELHDNSALPSATIQAAVFEDNAPTNGAPDVPAERGLAGFQGHISDYIDEVTTDVFGNPLCSEYTTPGNPDSLIAGTGGICLSQCYVVDNGVDIGTVLPDGANRCPVVATDLAPGDPTGIRMIGGGQVPATAVIEGKLKIPNLGPNRYALSITPPNTTNWVQTTTLEGNLDWDAWVMEGATGLDTEFVIAGEPFPAAIFGYVKPAEPSLGGSGTISGVVDAVKVYVPTNGGLALPGTIWGGLSGAKIDRPVKSPWLALTDLTNGDTAVWVGQGDASGHFSIPHVPTGNYTLTWWDTELNYILDLVNVTVANGETVDMGVLPLNGWWTRIDGYVYDDVNKNGKKDPGEAGLANYPVAMRKRENSLMDRGAVIATTDSNGYYVMDNAYPMTQWLVEEAYDDLHYTTGITYQADNQPNETTVLGEGVDVSVLPIIGLSGRLDWGKHSYEPGTNGGIVGTVSYGTTRNETDPRYSAVENWQPGVSNLPVHLYRPVTCGTTSGAPCDATGRYELEIEGGAFKKADADPSTLAIDPIDTYITETWQRPSGCVARDVDGNPVVQQVLPTDSSKECLEGPLMGIQFGPMEDSGNFGAAVDGNYGFGGLAPGDYLVEVEIPSDALDRPLYKFTREEDINIGNGDNFIPQIPPPECAGPLHTVNVAGLGTEVYGQMNVPDPSGNGGSAIVVPASTATVNATFADIGGSPYEGQPRPLCNMKLVRVSNGKSVAPLFEVFTDVPLPGRFWGLIVDDLNFSSDPKSLDYGEKAGVPFAPVGIYDWTNRLVTTVESDYNGLFDVLLPSTNRISCPTPSGVCANLYRMVGNDPGVPGRLNPNYHPEFRTISAEFEAFPGLIVPADLAPTQVGVTVQLPGGQVAQPLSCPLNVADTPTEKIVPALYAVSAPYATRPSGTGTVDIIIQGANFGAKTGPANVYLDTIAATTTSWIDDTITMRVNSSTVIGAHQLSIVAANGQKTVNGLTIHVLGSGYNPQLFLVGPGKTYPPANTLPATADHAIQDALDDAAAFIQGSNNNSSQGALVVVYPGTPAGNRQNPRGAYYENLIISSKVKLQGVGPGSADGSVPGSIIDAGAFGGDSPVVTAWYALINSLTWDGNQSIYDGAGISIFVPNAGRRAFPTTYSANTAPSIDGFDLRGGDQQGFPGNINVIGGGPTGQPGGLITQGGAIFANAYARNLQITNNVIQNNGAAYGTVRIGSPDVGNNQNGGVRIAHNRIIANGGTNLAGGIGLFTGASNYEVAFNDICGNFSAEYGGGISAFGLNYNSSLNFNASTNFGGKIHHNRIYFNRSYDEGGGIMIAGQLPANPASLSPGAGPVAIYNNIIQANLANDDGGGIRFLMAGNFPMNVYNNLIVNNVSTHEGGGISLNDAPNVRVYNNTIMKNITTATAVSSLGFPAPAGLSTSLHSIQLQTALGNPAINYSNPLLFNNIFWDNRAGTRSGNTVTGIGDAGNPWDLGAADASGLLSPTNSIIQQTTGYGGSNNLNADPQVVFAYDTGLDFAAWRTNPAFIGAIMVTADLPPALLGDYHLMAGSPAVNAGTGSQSGVTAPATDIDDANRTAPVDIGADEIQAAVVATTMHIGDLDVTTTNTSTSNWSAAVTITVHNASEVPLSGLGQSIVVSGTWSAGSGGSTSCTVTTGTGQCTVTRNLSKGSNPNATFTVTSVTKTGYTYLSASNHDPDGDSTGTAITAARLTMQVSNLAAIASRNNANTNWSTTVTITVRDSGGNPVSDASVSGSWSTSGSGNQGSGSGDCSTNTSGQCNVSRTGISLTRTSATYSVSGVTKSLGSPAVVYQAGATTNITVNRPN